MGKKHSYYRQKGMLYEKQTNLLCKVNGLAPLKPKAKSTPPRCSF